MQFSRPSIIVQHITTTWTKASRGGENASARNSTPEALMLPLSTFPATDQSLLLHQVYYSENDGFQHPQESWEQQPLTQPTRYDCLALSLEENTLNITLEWERCEGTPGRAPFPRTTFSLQPHQWGKLVYNTRLSRETGWIYRKCVLNIGYISPSSSTLFQRISPSYTHTDLAYLW